MKELSTLSEILRILVFCSTALTSTGWVRSTIKLSVHCPLALSSAMAVDKSRGDIKKERKLFLFSWIRTDRESNPGPPGDSQLCYAAPPFTHMSLSRVEFHLRSEI